ncbi:hypothetical protein ES705_14372 [subsurface metagenome]
MKQIIHIGYPKTGTTWFQNSFYPFVTNYHFHDREFINRKLIKSSLTDFDPNEFRKYIKQSKKINTIICEEMIAGRFRAGRINENLAFEYGYRLKKIFSNPIIIIFIRNQLDIIASMYFQYLKSGGNYSINRFLFNRGQTDLKEELLFSFKFFEYHRIINIYLDLFGQKNVHVFTYEDFQYNQLSFLKEFKSAYNMRINLDSVKLDYQNKSFSPQIIPIVKFLNSFNRRGYIFKRYYFNIPYLANISRRLYNSNLFINHNSSNNYLINSLKKDEYASVMEYYKESNHLLLSKYKMKSIRKFNYPL